MIDLFGLLLVLHISATVAVAGTAFMAPFIRRSARTAGQLRFAERSEDTMKKSWKESLCFGVYSTDGAQVGFMRVVTDGATFSHLCDVIVDAEHRGNGLGKWMIAVMVDHPRIRDTSIYLGTRDAHGLYEKYGFVRYEMMARRIAR